jgi:hypothetical protein
MPTAQGNCRFAAVVVDYSRSGWKQNHLRTSKHHQFRSSFGRT